MIELPECYVLANQINETLIGKTIVKVSVNASPHKFAAYTGDPSEYDKKLTHKKIIGANPGTGYTCGGNTEIFCEDMLLVISTPIKYHPVDSKLPVKHQLLIEFDDGSHLSCTVQMWGAMYCYPRNIHESSNEINKTGKSPSPLEDNFNREYFDTLLNGAKKTLSAKAFLATEQRIPGLGNGVLQDILFNARINPRTKLEKLNNNNFDDMYNSVKSTLSEMMLKGGRDTEKDLFGANGGYKTILSNKTLTRPCPVCSDKIVKETYLGGNIYYCPVCQPITI